MSLEAKDRLVRALVSVKLSTQLRFLCGGEGGGGDSTACTGASSLYTAPQAVRLPAQREMATQREDGHALPPPNHLQQTPV